MQAPKELEDLPEALPLRRVSPLWKYIAYVEAILIAGLALGFVVMVLVVWQQQARVFPTPAPFTAVPAPPPFPPSGQPSGPPVDEFKLPYPIRADLRAEQASKEQTDLRAEFLALGRESWRGQLGEIIHALRVSPDGTRSAYVLGEALFTGPIANPAQVYDARIGFVRPGLPPGAILPPIPGLARHDGFPTWTPDSQYIYVSRSSRQILPFNVKQGHYGEALPFRGLDPVPLPGDRKEYFVIRSVPTAKLDLGNGKNEADKVELVRCSTANDGTVILSARRESWSQPVLSPDGKKLAILARQDSTKKKGAFAKLHLLPLKEGAADGEPETLPIPDGDIGAYCWTPDSNQLVYGRTQDPTPADIWDRNSQAYNRSMDLFVYDLATKRETRLSRGGSFGSPSVSTDGELFYLAWELGQGASIPVLRQMALAKAVEFAAAHPDPPPHDPANLKAVFAAWGLSADEAKVFPTEQTLVKVAAAFEKAYKERFLAPAPNDLASHERLAKAVRALPATAQVQAKYVLGASRGEFLRKHNPAVWKVVQKPGAPRLGEYAPTPLENVFAVVVNPFDLELPLGSILDSAEGRTLVLTNSELVGSGELGSLVDSDLERGQVLLNTGDKELGERLLLEMLRKPEHVKNDYLAAVVAKALCDAGRASAIRKVLEARSQQPPASARKYSLLGYVYLQEREKAANRIAHAHLAVDAFRNALRCDLNCQPAYLNLSESHALAGDLAAARKCLERYLELFPQGTFAEDARRRLGLLGEGE